MDVPEALAAEPAAGMDTPQGSMTERGTDGFLDVMLASAPGGGATVPERTQPDRDMDEFLRTARSASFGREEDRIENPTVGQIEKSCPSTPASKLKKVDNLDTPDLLERLRPSVRRASKEIRAEQKQRAEKKTRRNAG